MVDPTPAGEGGISTVCADPAGVEFRLWQAKNRPGAQLTNTPGTWNFSDLHTADLDAARAFYSAVFGWEFVDLGFAHMITRPGYGDHLATTVDPGIHERQAGIDAPPGFADAIGWLNRATRRRDRALAGDVHGGEPRRNRSARNTTRWQSAVEHRLRMDPRGAHRRPRRRGVRRQPVQPGGAEQ